MKYHGYANAGCLLACATSLPDQHLKDILSSSVYMQLSCNNKFPLFADYKAWNERYSQVQRFCLYKLSGWLSYEGFSTSLDKSLTLAEMVCAALSEALSAEEKCLLERLMQDFSQLDADSKASILFRQRAVESVSPVLEGEGIVNRVRVQVGVVDDKSTVKCVILNIATRQPVEPCFLRQEFTLGEMVESIHAAYFVAQLDEDYADSKRAMVLRTLDGRETLEIERFV
jgi:hypothetical protein